MRNERISANTWTLSFIVKMKNGTTSIRKAGWYPRKYNEQNFLEMQGEIFQRKTNNPLNWIKDLSPDADWETTYDSQYGSMPAAEMFCLHGSHTTICTSVNWWSLGANYIERITQPYTIGTLAIGDKILKHKFRGG